MASERVPEFINETNNNPVHPTSYISLHEIPIYTSHIHIDIISYHTLYL